MVKLFLDTEFTGLHQNTTLISIAIVSEDHRAFYWELTDYDIWQVDDWMIKNILDNLICRVELDDKRKQLTANASVGWGPRDDLKDYLAEWLAYYVDDKVEIWSDCLAYDWVLFCEIFGGALEIPKNISYIPMDICTLFRAVGVDPDINREEFAGPTIEAWHHTYFDVSAGIKHNSLWDAYVIRACYNRLKPVYLMDRHAIFAVIENEKRLRKENAEMAKKIYPEQFNTRG